MWLPYTNLLKTKGVLHLFSALMIVPFHAIFHFHVIHAINYICMVTNRSLILYFISFHYIWDYESRVRDFSVHTYDAEVNFSTNTPSTIKQGKVPILSEEFFKRLKNLGKASLHLNVISKHHWNLGLIWSYNYGVCHVQSWAP